MTSRDGDGVCSPFQLNHLLIQREAPCTGQLQGDDG